MGKISQIFKNNDYSTTNTEEPRGRLEIRSPDRENDNPQSSKRKCLLISCIILAIIIGFILITVYAFHISGTESHNDGFSLPSDDGIILRADNRIWFFNLKTNKFTQLLESNNSIRAFDIYKNESIVWSEEDEPIIKYSSAEHKNITHTDKWKPQAISIDYITGNVYMIDKSTGTLNIIDKNGVHYNIVLSDLKNPHDFVMDVEAGIIFITQRLDSIIRVSMDGTNFTKIIDDQGASLLTIDSQNKRLYWVSDSTGIMSSNYEGTEVVKLLDYPYSLKGLTYQDGKIYWLVPKSRLSNATLIFCTIIDNECAEYSSQPIKFENPITLKAYHNKRNTEKIIKNPCLEENCSDLCLLTISGQSKCVCRLGLQLNGDMKTCRLITEYAMFIVGNVIRTQILDNRNNGSFIDVFLPLAFETGSLNYVEMINFDFHSKTYDFYFSNDLSINKINLINGEEQKVIFIVESGYTITDIAIDWLSDNLFYVKKSKSSDGNHLIMVMNLNNYSLHKTIKSFPVTPTVSGGCPYSLIVHPKRSKLFFTLMDGETDLYSIDIINPWKFYKGGKIEYYNKYDILAMDYQVERLYYPTYRNLTTNKRYLSIVDLFLRSERLLILPFPITEIISLYLYGDDIYIGNERMIWRFNKQSGRSTEKIYPRFERKTESSELLSPIKIFGPKIQSVYDEDYCKIDDCQQFCFAKPQKICSCIDNNVLEDGKRCV